MQLVVPRERLPRHWFLVSGRTGKVCPKDGGIIAILGISTHAPGDFNGENDGVTRAFFGYLLFKLEQAARIRSSAGNEPARNGDILQSI